MSATSSDSATSSAVRPGEGLSSVKHRKTRNPPKAVIDRTCPLGKPEDGSSLMTWIRSALGRAAGHELDECAHAAADGREQQREGFPAQTEEEQERITTVLIAATWGRSRSS